MKTAIKLVDIARQRYDALKVDKNYCANEKVMRLQPNLSVTSDDTALFIVDSFRLTMALLKV